MVKTANLKKIPIGTCLKHLVKYTCIFFLMYDMYDMVKIDTTVFDLVGGGGAFKASPSPVRQLSEISRIG